MNDQAGEKGRANLLSQPSATKSDAGLRSIQKRFPSVAHMRRAARWHMPAFAWDYLIGGIGIEENVRSNVDDLQRVLFMPRYLSAAPDPSIGTAIFGQTLSAPFGVAPIGLGGLMSPGGEIPIAQAARAGNVLHLLSTFATTSLETIKPHAGPSGWFQLYSPPDAVIEADLIRRAERAGYEVLVVTVDIPARTRRDRDIRNGLSVPPAFGLRNVLQMLARPTWLARIAQYGKPRFENLDPYAGSGGSMKETSDFLATFISAHITAERFKRIRDQWAGKLVVKGVLDPDEAAAYLALGADGIIVSNHGGRQLDAAPSSVAMLPHVRARVGKDALVMVDGGCRSGLDIARMIALGADYVFLGRPFMFSTAAIGNSGPAHLIDVLKAELIGTMAQLGCASLKDLPSFLHERVSGKI